MEIGIVISLIIVGIIAFYVGWQAAIHPDIVSNEHEKQLKRELQIQIDTKKEQINTLKTEAEKLKKQYQETQQYINDAEKNAESVYKSKMEALNIQYEKDKQKLVDDLKLKENIFNNWIKEEQNKIEIKREQQESDFSKRKDELQLEISEVQKELNSLKTTKIAAIEAARKEKLIHKNQKDYCLHIPIEEQNDISILQSVRNRVCKPRAISSVIWSAYFQPIAKKQFPQILGATDVCGIYKITNQETGECYIGQSTDVRKRWNDHCRAGCGIDTPQGNKLYKAIQEYGLEHFSFELLLECPPQELNEKERYFINLYSSDSLGYNSTAGNKG